MPHSGYIKRPMLENTDYKFYTHEDLTFNEFLLKHPGDYDPLTIFLLVVIKNNFKAGSSETETFKMVELGMLNIHIKPSFVRNNPQTISGYSFTSDIELKTYKLDAKDIINVRSEISTFKRPNRYAHDFPKRDYHLDDVNDFYTYLVTILIELDPF